MANKINYGLRNVYYAPVTVSGNAVTYGTPVAIPGAVNLSLSPNGGKTPFYADDIEYFTVYSNLGYTGTLEIADIPEAMMTSVLGYQKDNKGVLCENKDEQPKAFALMFEIQGDEKATKFVFYNVQADRSSIEASTKGESVEVKTATLDVTVKPAIDTGNVRGKSLSTVDSTVYANWTSSVYVIGTIVTA